MDPVCHWPDYTLSANPHPAADYLVDETHRVFRLCRSTLQVDELPSIMGNNGDSPSDTAHAVTIPNDFPPELLSEVCRRTFFSLVRARRFDAAAVVATRNRFLARHLYATFVDPSLPLSFRDVALGQTGVDTRDLVDDTTVLDSLYRLLFLVETFWRRLLQHRMDDIENDGEKRALVGMDIFMDTPWSSSFLPTPVSLVGKQGVKIDVRTMSADDRYADMPAPQIAIATACRQVVGDTVLFHNKDIKALGCTAEMNRPLLAFALWNRNGDEPYRRMRLNMWMLNKNALWAPFLRLLEEAFGPRVALICFPGRDATCTRPPWFPLLIRKAKVVGSPEY